MTAFSFTLLAIENALSDSGFIRIHKGFIVNQAAVKMLLSDEAKLTNGTVENGDNDGIISILNMLSDKNKKQAEKILTAFAEAVNSD